MLVVQCPLQQQFHQIALEVALVFQCLGQLEQVPGQHLVVGLLEALDREPAYVLVRVGVVEELERLLRGQQRPPLQQGVQGGHLAGVGVVNGVNDPGEQIGQVGEAVLPDLPDQVFLLLRDVVQRVPVGDQLELLGEHLRDGAADAAVDLGVLLLVRQQLFLGVLDEPELALEVAPAPRVKGQDQVGRFLVIGIGDALPEGAEVVEGGHALVDLVVPHVEGVLPLELGLVVEDVGVDPEQGVNAALALENAHAQFGHPGEPRDWQVKLYGLIK